MNWRIRRQVFDVCIFGNLTQLAAEWVHGGIDVRFFIIEKFQRQNPPSGQRLPHDFFHSPSRKSRSSIRSKRFLSHAFENRLTC